MQLNTLLARGALAFVLAHAAWLAPTAALAQHNSPQAIEAARKHRAEQAGATPAVETGQSRSRYEQPFRSSADPTANPRASLKSCLNHSGMNMAARDRCMRQHCEGRWGQGDCPAQGGDLTTRSGANSRTPLGRCLAEAGANPFRRDACGWRHCNNKWHTAECAAIKPRSTPSAQ